MQIMLIPPFFVIEVFKMLKFIIDCWEIIPILIEMTIYVRYYAYFHLL